MVTKSLFFRGVGHFPSDTQSNKTLHNYGNTSMIKSNSSFIKAHKMWVTLSTDRSNIQRLRWRSVCQCRTCRSCWCPTSCGSWCHGGRRIASLQSRLYTLSSSGTERRRLSLTQSDISNISRCQSQLSFITCFYIINNGSETRTKISEIKTSWNDRIHLWKTFI